MQQSTQQTMQTDTEIKADLQKNKAATGKKSTRKRPSSELKKSPYPGAAGKAMLVAARVRVALWDRALRHLEEAQMRQLLDITQHSKTSDFGRRHGFGEIKTYDDYARRVPVGDYDSFSPYIDRMRTGERGLLVPEKIEFFGNSSGSSNQGKMKFLPISERQLVTARGSAADSLFRYLDYKGVDDFTSGFTMGLVPPIQMKQEGPVFITTNPSLMYKRAPFFTKPVQLPELDVLQISDYDKKLGVIADRYLDHDVRAVAGTTCWFSVLFDKLIAAAQSRGRNVSTIQEIWPNLGVLLGGGVAADPYIPVITDRMGTRDFALVDTYNATEGGIYACTDHTAEPGMLMIPDRGVFYEFIPVEGAGDLSIGEWPTRVPLWAVEKNKLYAIVVTTQSGLYSYKLGDLVRFTSTNPHRIEFAGRLSGCLSTTQELTTHVEIQRAMEFALSQYPGTTVDYGCGADIGVNGTSKSRYVLFAEFEGTSPDMEKFAKAFDEGLCKENRVYREHRVDNVGIFAPVAYALPRGSVTRFMKDIGNTSVQTKFPRILDANRVAILRGYVAS